MNVRTCHIASVHTNHTHRDVGTDIIICLGLIAVC